MKVLQRPRNEAKIAGVCAGLGHYFGLDPVFFRILFILLAFAGGTGLLAYVIFWILVPAVEGGAAAAASFVRLKLSREDRKIAGVCGGLGELCGVDPVFFRVAFVVLAFCGGFGLLLYVLLWLLLPSASPDREQHPGAA